MIWQLSLSDVLVEVGLHVGCVFVKMSALVFVSVYICTVSSKKNEQRGNSRHVILLIWRAFMRKPRNDFSDILLIVQLNAFIFLYSVLDVEVAAGLQSASFFMPSAWT